MKIIDSGFLAFANVTSVSTHLAYRADIDGLRAVAVLAVIVFHAFPSLLRGGFVGVDIFFVISGYLISTIIFRGLQAGHFSFIDFYSRRIKRIFPSLLVVLTASFAAGWFLLQADEFKQLGNHIARGAAFSANFALLKESGYFDTAAEIKPMLHLWSLGIEEQFYIVWPLVLWCAWKMRINALVLIVLALGISFFLNVRGIHAQDELAKVFYSPQTRFWEILIGSFLAYISLQKQVSQHTILRKSSFVSQSSVALNSARSLVGAGLILCSLVLILPGQAFPGWWALMPTLGAALVISSGQSAWINRSVLSHPVLVWIGQVSFPLYLWHWPLLSFARIIEGETPSVWVRGLAVGLAFLLAWLTKKFIEDPIRFSIRNKNANVALLLLMLSVVSYIGYYTFVREGFPSRHGKTALSREVGYLECANEKADSGCAFGNPKAEKLIVLYGDSHAKHLATALNEVFGQDYRFQMVANGHCFMGGRMTFPHVGNINHCNQAREKLQSLQGEKIYAVIRSQWWQVYGLTNQEQIEVAINDAIEVAGLQPEKLIIVGSTANMDLDCEIKNYYAMSADIRKQCKIDGTSKELNKTFMVATDSMLVPANVRFVYPYKYVCPNDECMAIKGNTALYTDFNHLSKGGAMLVMPAIATMLKN